MADVITRFKLETTQYDSKLRDAAKGLKEFTHQAQLGGKGFTDFSQKAVESARALGNTASGATNTKEKVRDLVGAFNEAARAYNSLSEAQQQHDFGKNLAASLETLKGRITEAKKELYGLDDAMGKSGGGGLFSGLGDKMSGSLQVFAGNMYTKAAGAIANLGSEMVGLVQQGVELAKQGEGIRIAFERLNQPELLDNLKEATHGTVSEIELMKQAIKFENFKLPLEDLSAYLAFAQQKAKDTGESIDYLVTSIVNGLGRQSKQILDNLGISASELTRRMNEGATMTEAVAAIIKEEMAKAGDYVETAADRAAQATASLTDKMEELGRKFLPVQEASDNLFTSMKIAILDIVGGPLARLLNGLTEAGRLKNMLNDMNGGGGGAETNTERQLRMLREYSGGGKGIEGKRDLYNRQIAEYRKKEEKAWRDANRLREELKGLREQQTSNGFAGNLSPLISDVSRQLEAAENRAKAIQVMRANYETGAKGILNPSSPASKSLSITSTGKTGGKSGKDEVEAAIGSIDYQTKKVQELQKAWRAAADDNSREKIKKEIEEQQYVLDRMTGKEKFDQSKMQSVSVSASVSGGVTTDLKKTLDAKTFNIGTITPLKALEDELARLKALQQEFGGASAEAWQAYQAEINKTQDSINKITGDAKVVKGSFREAASAVGSLGSALSGLDDPGAKIAGTVAQAIANIALAFSSADLKDGETGNVWYWIASTAAGLATMVSTISSIHAATKYAEGGMIKGNSYSGDNILGVNNSTGELVGLNAGEIVLNQAQTANVANALEGGGMRGIDLSAVVTGEQIFLVTNRYTKRTGQGEIVTWK